MLILYLKGVETATSNASGWVLLITSHQEAKCITSLDSKDSNSRAENKSLQFSLWFPYLS